MWQSEAFSVNRVFPILADRDALLSYMEDQKRFREWVSSRGSSLHVNCVDQGCMRSGLSIQQQKEQAENSQVLMYALTEITRIKQKVRV